MRLEEKGARRLPLVLGCALSIINYWGPGSTELFVSSSRASKFTDSKSRTGVCKHNSCAHMRNFKALKEVPAARREDTGKSHELMPIPLSEDAESTP